MKKYLLGGSGNFYKANLHSHTNLSDGCLTPEQMKEEYMKKGYSIIAYTDHNTMIDHSDLAEENFLPLLGFEIDISEKTTAPRGRRTCHICFIAIDPENKVQPFWERSGKYLFGNSKNQIDKVIFDENEPDYIRNYAVEDVNYVMQTAREKGFFVTYNHPVWSGETFEQYAYYRGMHAMEIFNTGCYVLGLPEYNPKIYDDILREDNRIYCIAADDNHNGSADWDLDSFIGHTVINADKLEYKTITKALLDGKFYASTGPEIHSLYLEDNVVHITCSPAKTITLNTGRVRSSSQRRVAQKGEYLTEAQFKINPDADIYFRLDVYDETGMSANTSAYFCDEIFKN